MPKTAKELFIYITLLFILLLTSINIDTYLKPKETKVLGAETQDTNNIYWKEFLTNNPDYIPGWIEMGDIDKVNEINPNYFIMP